MFVVSSFGSVDQFEIQKSNKIIFMSKDYLIELESNFYPLIQILFDVLQF